MIDMQFRKLLLFVPFMAASQLFAQTYTSYRTGNAVSISTEPLGGVCLMGGATENDNAMRWFLDRASGGDVLVLRTSGSDGYNAYFYTDLGVTLNSVETIVCNNASASQETYLHQRIQEAEAIWFAGGDQWEYISFWRNTPVDSLIRLAVQTRNVAIGGTSAGMAIQGQAYFTAQNGTITSSQALLNPYASNFTVDTLTFLGIDALNGIITDTHFDNPDRRGRTTAFLGRLLADLNQNYNGIACDEYVAVCIANDTARVFGDFPNYDDNAYFISPNCALNSNVPETCSMSIPLSWDLGGEALSVCRIRGTQTGANLFTIDNWKPINAADWFYWSVNNGVFQETPGVEPLCLLNAETGTSLDKEINIMTDNGVLTVNFESPNYPVEVRIFDLTGKLIQAQTLSSKGESLRLTEFAHGTYCIQLKASSFIHQQKLVF